MREQSGTRYRTPWARQAPACRVETWASSIQPTAEEFTEHAKPIVIDADHTLLMSDHMPHAGGDMAGRRGHTIITRPDLMSRKLSEKKTFWLAPEQSRDA